MQKKNEQKVHHGACAVCRLHPHSREAKRHQAINRVLSKLNERNKRRFAGVLTNEEGRGGITHLTSSFFIRDNSICIGH
jgi:hypothetical protein